MTENRKLRNKDIWGLGALVVVYFFWAPSAIGVDENENDIAAILRKLATRPTRGGLVS